MSNGMICVHYFASFDDLAIATYGSSHFWLVEIGCILTCTL